MTMNGREMAGGGDSNPPKGSSKRPNDASLRIRRHAFISLGGSRNYGIGAHTLMAGHT